MAPHLLHGAGLTYCNHPGAVMLNNMPLVIAKALIMIGTYHIFLQRRVRGSTVAELGNHPSQRAMHHPSCPASVQKMCQSTTRRTATPWTRLPPG